MKTEASRKQLMEMANEVLELSNLGALARARGKAKGGEAAHHFSETEFLTLDCLVKHGAQTVGDIQKSIGVLPAQMSRIMRALEQKSGGPFVQCSINPEDRRRVDVSITPEGKAGYDAYRSVRLALTAEVLAGLAPDDRDEFIRILRVMRTHMDNRLQKK
jgi:DNA-binding MarR family transcriptional regulator